MKAKRQIQFQENSLGDVVQLVSRNPLAWLFLNDDNGSFAVAAPMRLKLLDGRLDKLVGHLPRNSRAARAVPEYPEALILFIGPNGYVSPSWFTDRRQAPTWNYASVQLSVQLSVVHDREFLEQHLVDLTQAMEDGMPTAWQVGELGSRYGELTERIVTIEARIDEFVARFKLGQDESDETLSDILNVLESRGNTDLLEAMRHFNQKRL